MREREKEKKKTSYGHLPKARPRIEIPSYKLYPSLHCSNRCRAATRLINSYANRSLFVIISILHPLSFPRRKNRGRRSRRFRGYLWKTRGQRGRTVSKLEYRPGNGGERPPLIASPASPHLPLLALPVIRHYLINCSRRGGGGARVCVYD